jgi:hypothetical protein
VTMHQLRLARLASSPEERAKALKDFSDTRIERTKASEKPSGDKIRFVAAHLAGAPLDEFGSKTQIKLFELAMAAIKACDAWEQR